MQNDTIVQSMDRTDGGLVRSVKEFAVVKRSVVVGGHKTSVSLEDAFWTSLKDIATRRGLPALDPDRRYRPHAQDRQPVVRDQAVRAGSLSYPRRHVDVYR